LHLHPAYQKTFGYSTGAFPNAEWLFERAVSLPIYPRMTDDDVAMVIDAVRQAWTDPR
jgi:dTDP-4-amino-4,6-dideoxygalactose transaminase